MQDYIRTAGAERFFFFSLCLDERRKYRHGELLDYLVSVADWNSPPNIRNRSTDFLLSPLLEH